MGAEGVCEGWRRKAPSKQVPGAVCGRPTTLGTVLPQPRHCSAQAKRRLAQTQYNAYSLSLWERWHARACRRGLSLQLLKQLQIFPLDLLEGDEIIAQINFQLWLVAVAFFAQKFSQIKIEHIVVNCLYKRFLLG